MKEPSVLTRRIVTLLERIRGSAVSEADCTLIESILDSHDLSHGSPPSWMVELLDDVLKKCVGSTRLVPTGYPHGENGLANVLADVEEEFGPLGIEDYGEGVTWPIPAVGVRVVVIRECREPGHVVVRVTRLGKGEQRFQHGPTKQPPDQPGA